MWPLMVPPLLLLLLLLRSGLAGQVGAHRAVADTGEWGTGGRRGGASIWLSYRQDVWGGVLGQRRPPWLWGGVCGSEPSLRHAWLRVTIRPQLWSAQPLVTLRLAGAEWGGKGDSEAPCGFSLTLCSPSSCQGLSTSEGAPCRCPHPHCAGGGGTRVSD